MIPHESKVVLRERGCMRIPESIFLLAWLCGWAVGEVFAGRGFIWMVQQILAGKAGGTEWISAIFLAIWLTFWTLGGVGAAVALVRGIAGSDEIEFTPEEWRVSRLVAGFGWTRSIPVADIRAVLLVQRGTLVAELADRDIVLTRYGTKEEKQAIISRFTPRENLDEELPRRWRAVPEGDRLRIEPRAVDSPGCLVICGLIAIGAAAPFFFVDTLPRLGLLIPAFFAAITIWGTFSRRGWLVRRGELASFVAFPGWRREVVFDRQSLIVRSSTDADGDGTFTLIATVNGKERTLFWERNDERTAMRLGRFLVRQAGWRWNDPQEFERGLRYRS